MSGLLSAIFWGLTTVAVYWLLWGQYVQVGVLQSETQQTFLFTLVLSAVVLGAAAAGLGFLIGQWALRAEMSFLAWVFGWILIPFAISILGGAAFVAAGALLSWNILPGGALLFTALLFVICMLPIGLCTVPLPVVTLLIRRKTRRKIDTVADGSWWIMGV